jgi:WD40 repeat protein
LEGGSAFVHAVASGSLIRSVQSTNPETDFVGAIFHPHVANQVRFSLTISNHKRFHTVLCLQLYTCAADGLVRLWNFETGSAIQVESNYPKVSSFSQLKAS